MSIPRDTCELGQDSPLQVPVKTTMTLEEFLEHDTEGYEYVKGELVPMSAASIGHGKISVRVIRYLDPHVHRNQLGEVFTAETTFRVGERLVKPDVAFASTARVPEDETKGFPIPPDLAVEVISPTDTQWDVSEKVQDYLDAGTQMVWVIDPVLQTVAVYRPNTDYKLLKRGNTLNGEDVVEGFSCQVAQLFE